MQMSTFTYNLQRTTVFVLCFSISRPTFFSAIVLIGESLYLSKVSGGISLWEDVWHVRIESQTLDAKQSNTFPGFYSCLLGEVGVSHRIK